MDKQFVLAEVKASEDGDEFLSVLSAPTLDRDNERILANAFSPLPDSLPIHAFHDFNNPVARGVPFYEDGILKVKGTFASTPRAQEIRTLVKEGIIGSMSIGFMSAQREPGDDGVTNIVKAEALEGSFVSVPSNREAAVLMAKEYRAKVGARNSAADGERLQTAHDVLTELGAKCAPVEDERGVMLTPTSYATGGVVRRSQPYTVGERGVEAFIPKEVPEVKTEGEENSAGMPPVDQARLAIARLEADLLLAD